MSEYQFTLPALDDLIQIWTFIVRDNSEAAARVEAAVLRACSFLADSPLAGQVRSNLTSLPLRFWVVQPYSNFLIVYDPATKPLQVVRILHGARDVRSLLG